MMTTPMTNVLFLALALALAFIGLSAIDSGHARTLPDRFGLKVAKTLATPPPPCMVHSSKSKESTRDYQKYLTSPPPTTSYDQETLSSPPRSDSTKGQLDIESPCSNEESPCINDGCISMITDFERPIPSSNPPPKQHTPTVPLLRPKSPPRQYLVSARNHHPKSPPRPDSTKGQLDMESPSSNEESPCINDGCISMITDFERPIPSSNPPPKQQTPTVPLLRPKSPPRQYYLVSARNHHP